jgi:hypothetical protein
LIYLEQLLNHKYTVGVWTSGKGRISEMAFQASVERKQGYSPDAWFRLFRHGGNEPWRSIGDKIVFGSIYIGQNWSVCLID